MRADREDLTETIIDGGHEIMLERPVEVNQSIAAWRSVKHLTPAG